MVLNALTTFAPVASNATFSAADVVVPTDRPLRSEYSGLVASITTLFVRSPALAIADSVASQGVAKSTTWLVAAASDADVARAFGPARFTRSDISGDAELRDANATLCPPCAHR